MEFTERAVGVIHVLYKVRRSVDYNHNSSRLQVLGGGWVGVGQLLRLFGIFVAGLGG